MNQYFGNISTLASLLTQKNSPFCFENCQSTVPEVVPSLNFKLRPEAEFECQKSSHDSTSQGSYPNQR